MLNANIASTTAATLLSYAKINLFLRITHQQENGYHCLQSVFMRINLCDYIKIYPQTHYYISVQYVHSQEEFDNLPKKQYIKRLNRGLNLSISNQSSSSHPYIPVAHDLNLKAARLLQNYIKLECPHIIVQGAHICVYKNIPMGAGLGGGSSNAAHVLLILNKLWNLNLDIVTLCKLGLNLGADVPFFIHQIHAAWVEGIGEDIQKMNVAKCYFIIIKPNIHISTKRIFTHADFQRNNARIDVPYQYIERYVDGEATLAHNTNIAEYTDICDMYHYGNTLQSVVFDMYPHLAHWFGQKYADITFQMTGSGSCFFAIFQHENKYNLALNELKAYLPNNWVIYSAQSI